MQTSLELDTWLQREQFINAENKIKKFELFLHQYLKNNICDIQLIPLDHITYQ